MRSLSSHKLQIEVGRYTGTFGRGIFMQNEETANIISDTSSQQAFENLMSSSDKKAINHIGKFITDGFILCDGSLI